MVAPTRHHVPDITTELISLGIRQAGDSILTRLTTHFDLAKDDPGSVFHRLRATLTHTLNIYEFRNGMGLSAPQIGISKSACIFGQSLETLISIFNPVILERSDDYDEAYEGCLSFWSCRGLVPRARKICLGGYEENGRPVVYRLEGVMARMAQHEYDHLQGILYTSRMGKETATIGLSEYSEIRKSGSARKP